MFLWGLGAPTFGHVHSLTARPWQPVIASVGTQCPRTSETLILQTGRQRFSVGKGGKAELSLKPDPSCVKTPNTHLLGILLARPGTSAYWARGKAGES